MPLSFESPDDDSRLKHYRLMTATNANGQAALKAPPAGIAINRINLLSVANFMNVPVVLAAYQDQHGVEAFAAHGMTLTENLATFAAACTDLCKKGVIVVPDTHTHTILGRIVRQLPVSDIRFMVAIPLRDKASQYVGSLAVINTSKAVALNGISFANLMAVGDAFAATGNLQAITSIK